MEVSLRSGAAFICVGSGRGWFRRAGRIWPQMMAERKQHSRGAGNRRGITTQKNAASPKGDGVFSIMTRKEECFVLGRPGSDLLSQGLSHSTIGAEEFNGRVRDGIGFKLLARTTRPAKDKDTKQAERFKRSKVFAH